MLVDRHSSTGTLIMHFLRLLILLGVLMATQGRVVEQDKTPEEVKPVEVKQEIAKENQGNQHELDTVNTQSLSNNPSSEAVKPDDKVIEVARESQPQTDSSINSQVVPSEAKKAEEPKNEEAKVAQAVEENQPQQAASSAANIPEEVHQSVTNGNQDTKPQSVNLTNTSDIAENPSSQAIKKDVVNIHEISPNVQKSEDVFSGDGQPAEVEPLVNSESQETQANSGKESKKVTQEGKPISNEILKVQEETKQEGPKMPCDAHRRGNKIQARKPELDKIFDYQDVINGFQSSHEFLNQNLFDKVQLVPDVSPLDDIHNHTQFFSSDMKPGLPFPFLPNPFEKVEEQPTYVTVNVNETNTGNVTQQIIQEEIKPFPFLPNPFTDFPKIVGLSLVLLPNPFYVNKTQVVSQPAGSQEKVEVEYFGKFRGLSENSQKKQKTSQKNNFYLVRNPLANQVSKDGKRGEANVLLPVNLAALPLLVPGSEVSQEKTSSKGKEFQNGIKTSNLLQHPTFRFLKDFFNGFYQ
ncbi:LOW QUALITY PROTEIN: uncharacterized protein LOC108100321 [Drosophila ficusphila]|uniref:LOW QUALITY PROTEIN: uncharacterized protein LOC108100321 n=1 Tax=Drosophila ficusphila TaxID=30025 RepID=UPI001C8A6E41|nr:LOW QUALITY PROTEIN: uncharacterized protein LOC108100321 [Drosophila ficusphila]